MSYLLDTHTHTIASGHAFSTVQEMAREAHNKGLEMLCITDHGPDMPGGPHMFHLATQRVIPPTIYGVEILKGVEANIMNYTGGLDVPEWILKKLDIVIASLHDVCINPGSREENTMAILGAMENHYVDIIAHPGNPAFEIDNEKVVLHAKKTNTLIEINNSSLSEEGSRRGSIENCIEIAKLCKKYNVSISIGSDAHISFDIGKFDKAISILNDINMPEELIINGKPEKLKEYLRDKGKSRFMTDTDTPDF